MTATTRRERSFRLALSSGAAAAILACALSSPAFAQTAGTAAQTTEDDAAGELVVVTGSRIRGVEAVGSSVIGFEREDILETGAPTTGDLLREAPQIIGLGASETGSSAQNGAANVSRAMAVNLRGIGSNATLVLFNGRRLPPAGTQGQVTDASVIPALGVARMEIVPDGGSAIYGSDAVTGVVNIIPRAGFSGQESSARAGFADGYMDYTVGHIAGFEWSGGNLTLTGEYNHHSDLKGEDRDFYTSDLRAQGGSDFRSQQCAPGNIVVGGVPYAIPAGGVTPATAGTLVAGTRNLCDNLKRGDIIPEIDRATVMATFEQDITDALTIFADGYFSRREFELTDAQVVSNLTVTSANPFYVNPTGGTGPVTVQYDFANDGGLPTNPGFAESWQGVLGARYDIGAWQLEGYLSHGESEDEVSRTQNLNTTPAGINAFLASTNPSVAFNPFGPGGTSPAATIAGIRNGQFVIQGATKLDVYAAKADGPLFSLPAGSVRAAVGAEFRKEELTGLLQSGSTTAPVLVPSKSSRDVTALFAEIFVPVFAEGQGIGKLDVSVAGRYEEYSDFGETFNPKIGVVWAPIPDIALRGSWGESFRAPGLAENDPRSGGYGLYGDTLPCNHLPPATTCFGIGIAGGNPDLQPEEATTWSFGVEFNPEWLPGLDASVTWFDIDYTNQIIGLRGTAGLLTNPVYAQYRTLNPTSAEVTALLGSGLPINSPINASLVTYIQDGRRQNLGGLVASGLDFDVRHVWETGMGDFSAGVQGAWFSELATATAPGAPFIDQLNTLNFPQQLRVRATAGWRKDGASVRAFLNHVNSYDQTGVTPVRSIDAYNTLDLNAGYNFDGPGALKGASISLDISNAFDEDPPFVNIAGGYDPQSASPIGRLVAISLRKAW